MNFISTQVMFNGKHFIMALLDLTFHPCLRGRKEERRGEEEGEGRKEGKEEVRR